MHLRIGLLVTLVVSLLLAGASGSGGDALAAPGYTMVDLGTLPGYAFSQAYAINASGQIVGSSSGVCSGIGSTCSDIAHAVLWDHGQVMDLGTLPGDSTSEALGINDRGQVVGYSALDTRQNELRHAFLWQASTGMQDLGTLPGGDGSEAQAINNRGQIIGWSDSGPPTHTRRAVVWDDDRITDLRTLPAIASGDSQATGINDRGQIVGWSVSDTRTGRQHAVMWNDGKITDLSTLPGAWTDESQATAINNRGQIVGVLGAHAALWGNGRITDLGTLPAAGNTSSSSSYATAINELGQVVGYSISCIGDPGQCVVRPVTWDNGQISDLGSPPGTSPFGTFRATAIDNRGQIVGWSSIGTTTNCCLAYQHAVLWEPEDLAPPTTVANVSPLANVAGWNRTSVTVTLQATQPDGLADVQQITYSATGAQPIPSTTIQGSTATLTISAEGTTTLTYFAIDQAGNREQPQTVTVRIDRTAPTVSFGAPSPPPNAEGWNTTDVSIPFTASDALSGVASTTPASSPLVLTAEGTAVTGTVQVTDVAGNTATSTSPAVKIDKTPPVTTAAPNPAPNAAGWNSTNVAVTLTTTDSLSGVDHTEYTLDGASWTAYTGPVAVTAEGAHALQYRSIDKAGNVETAHQLTVRIDTTPPEAVIQFDPTKQDFVVIGKDAGSGVPAGPVAPSSVVPSSWSPGDAGADAKPDGNDKSAELRTYLLTDLAGNTTSLVLKVQRPGHDHHLKARLVSIQSGSTPAVTFGSNSEEFQWDLAKDGTLAKLDQQVRIGTGHDQQAVEAHFEARQGQTDIRVKNPQPQPVMQKPGLDLLQIVTAKGQLSVAY